MDKELAVKQLLMIHCDGCNGKVFGCRGCTKEVDIRDIVYQLDLNIKEIKEVVEEEVPKKKKK